MSVKLLDCTLRDGGYHNSWDFGLDLIEDYVRAMDALRIDFVELGFRSLETSGYQGPTAYTTDRFISGLKIPDGLKLGVMINAGELVNHPDGPEAPLRKMFRPADESPVSLVRIASHVHEFGTAIDGGRWLKEQGYLVGINLMQIADRSTEEIEAIAEMANRYPIDVLYFADSLGSLTPDRIASIIRSLRTHWHGELGVHTHDNMGNALANSLRSLEEGATWIDGTVTGMGRGPGNAKTEYLAIELEPLRATPGNITPLLTVIDRHFRPLQNRYGWGTNPYYYLAGKYGIHPTYIQEMLGDRRYSEEDLQAVIEHLKADGGKKFSFSTLESARHFYKGDPHGTWRPSDLVTGRDVLVLGTGPGVATHRAAIEAYVRSVRPFVIALNTQSAIAPELIDIRAACHPVRLLADCAEHLKLPQPLATPASMLPDKLQEALKEKTLLDYGLTVKADTFAFGETCCTVPASLVIAYVLAICAAGGANQILLAGFDGYPAGDPRNDESEHIFRVYQAEGTGPDIISITPTRYTTIRSRSIYQALV